MHRQLRSHLTFANVTSLIALFAALGGTTYAATGGNFILGQANTAGTPTQLSSPTTTAAGALKVTNTNTTTAGRGISALGGAGGFGLWASGGNATKNTAAIHGQSTAGNAVEGISGNGIASGVYGQNTSTGYGVAGRSNGTGVLGDSQGGTGVLGNTTNGIGVTGQAALGGTGVLGKSTNGWAFEASGTGDVKQTRTGGGFVKAMAYVDPQATDPILQCFNSHGINQGLSGNCGIIYSSNESGRYTLNFGFKVDDRFVSATPRRSFILAVTSVAGNSLEFEARTGSTGVLGDTAFWVIVF
jgi:hypothetical protein